jgi:RNA polymerase sigma factor (sigma-70 family)
LPPPVAEPLATRIFLGPALRTQSDHRLVTLVRDGYETAFEEIVRRYRKPLDRFAASFVGSRSEDVTQDAFSKALLALRGTTTEIELRPWLYRIVRNAALNDIRDRPPSAEQLAETLQGGQSAAVEAERREEMTELMERLGALPEPQRAAIVMRELEGLSHEEIAASLGVSGGAARQAIYRARATLRDGFGLLVPLPLLRMLFDHGAEAAAGSAAAAGATTVAGASLGGIGAGGAVKAGLATVLIAGSVGAAGVAIQQERSGHGGPDTAAAAVAPRASQGEGGSSGGSSGDSGGGFETGDGHGAPGAAGPGDDRGGDRSSDHSGSGSSGRGSDSGPGSGGDDLSSGNGSGGGDSGHHSGRGSGSGGDDDSGHGGDDSGSGDSGSGSSGSGHSGSGQSGLDDLVEDGGHHSGSGDSGSGGGDDALADDSSGSGSGSGGSPPLPPAEPALDDDGGSDSGSGSGSSGSGSSDVD